MDVFELFDPAACNISGKKWSDKRTWHQYFENKKKLEAEWVQVVLVDMIAYPVEWAVQISNELFFDKKYPDETYFVLYCHSGGSSWYIQKQLTTKLPQYNFINLDGGIMWYQMLKM